MQAFYITTASNMPNGAGYWEIHAPSEEDARALAFKHCPDGRWSFLYTSLEKVHPLDRVKHGTIGTPAA